MCTHMLNLHKRTCAVQDAEELYESAVGKLRAVLSSNPGNQAAERACGLALLDWGTQAGLEPQEAAKHLQVCRCPAWVSLVINVPAAG